MKPQQYLSAAYLQQLCSENKIDPNLYDESQQDRLKIRHIEGVLTLEEFKASKQKENARSGGPGWTWNQIMDMYANAIDGGATWQECNESCTYYYGITIWALILLYFMFAV